MPPFPIRIAYVVEFFLALIAIVMLWALVGGQGHLDLMPWYDKFVLPVSLAWVTVVATASAAGRQRSWNKVTIACAVAALVLIVSMGLLTYYYHLHEDEDDDGQNGDAVTTMLIVPGPRL